jgi:hypothetical protein
MQLLDTMFIKRFCLPIDSDIELYENGSSTLNKCLCSTFNHAACVLQGKGVYEKDKNIKFWSESNSRQ